MPLPRVQAVCQTDSLVQTVSGLVSLISQLLHRHHDLETEEAKLDAEARQLWDQLLKSNEKPASLVSQAITPVSTRATNAIDQDEPSTPPHIDPRNIETPVKAYLLLESFTLAMSAKSKRRGRIFWTGDSTEFGERKLG